MPRGIETPLRAAAEQQQLLQCADEEKPFLALEQDEGISGIDSAQQKYKARIKKRRLSEYDEQDAFHGSQACVNSLVVNTGCIRGK